MIEIKHTYREGSALAHMNLEFLEEVVYYDASPSFVMGLYTQDYMKGLNIVV